MRAEWMAWTKAHPGQYPKAMYVGSDLFEMYESELIACERFTDSADAFPSEPSLKFKSATVRARGRGYGVSLSA
jgi:hypothetical protein